MPNINSAIVTAALFLASVNVYCQGFSGTLGMGEGKSVGIKRLLPATVNLNQKRIAVQASSVIKTHEELVAILQTKLITMIQRDPRFIIDQSNPQTLLRFTLTNSYVDAKNYSVGEGNNAHVCEAFVGKLEVSYQALDAANMAPLDSENLVSAITSDNGKSNGGFFSDILKRGSGACGTDAKDSLHTAEDFLVDGIVHEMGQRAAPSEEVIAVKLPGKKLEPLSRLAMAQRWGTLQESAEKLAPLNKPEEDAYRKYLIGVAEEAQAYDLAREAALREQGKRSDISPEQAEADFQKAQQLLDQARKAYKDAIQAKPGEKEFLVPDTRMEKAIAVYATIQRHKDEYQRFVAQQAAARAVTQRAAVSALQPAPSKAGLGLAGGPLEQIVKFCQAGADMPIISEYIQDSSFLEDARASSYKFNIRADPLVLASNCKDKASTIQRLMRARLAPRRPAPAVH